MRTKILSLILVCLIQLAASAALVEVDTTYRVTKIKHQDRTFGIALLQDDPEDTQNEVWVEENTKIWRVLKLKDGTTKEVPMTTAKFFVNLRKGDILRVHAGRDWDGSLHAYEIWLKT